jgi:hypothetical protein
MNPEELHRLIEEYRDGTISLADARRLADAIRADGKSARELAFTGHLAQALEGADDESFARSFAERLRAEGGGSEFVRAFEKRSRLRPTVRTRRVEASRPSLVPFLVAAGILLAILGVLLSRPAPAPQTEARREVPAPPPEEPKIEPQAVPEPQPLPREEPPQVVPPAPLPPPPLKPEESQPPAPSKAVPPPAPAPLKQTEVARPSVAKFDRVEGEVYVLTGADRKAASRGEEIPPGSGVATGVKAVQASILLPDGTRFSLGADAVIREISKGPRGTRVTIVQGVLSADVAKQSVEQPLVFATPHAEARVIGTVLRLVVDAGSTRLEVKEGKVRLTRETRNVDVSAGQYAVAAPGTTLAARALFPEEIVLHAQQAKLTGNEWSLVRDVKSLTGVVLEAGSTTFKVVDHVEARPSYATFTFFAPADREYRIWMRATSLEKGDPWNRDMVTIEPTRAVLSQKSPFFGAAPTLAYVFTGVAVTPGFTWMSGHGEEGKAEGPPLTVRFAETGPQNIRVYVGHPWVRVDAIWLSATQKTRPPAKQLPPLPEK